MRDYQRIAIDSASRRENYAAMLPAFYDIATNPYRRNWGDCFHLPPFTGRQTLAEAVLAQEHAMADEAGFRRGMRLLDIGCGIGGPALSIARHSGAHVTGVNIVAMHVGIARAKAAEQGLEDRTAFVVGDMMGLPFPPESFDGAFSFDAICHCPDKAAAYAEIARVLKPGAPFTGCDWLCANGLTAEEYEEWIEPICASSALPTVLSLSQVAKELSAAGFTVEECKDLAAYGDMTPNWELFERAADTIDRSKGTAMELMWRHATYTARGGRAGTFVVGRWLARKD